MSFANPISAWENVTVAEASVTIMIKHLDEMEREEGVRFHTRVRVAAEARSWMVRLGVPFTVDGLLRAVLREGFPHGSLFESLDLNLSKPMRRRDRATQPPDPTGRLAAPPPVLHCLRLATRIMRGLSPQADDLEAGPDAVVMAAALACPDTLIRNLIPRDLAERSMTAARVVAMRALSSGVGQSKFRTLREAGAIREYMEARAHFDGWRLERWVVLPSSSDRRLFVHARLRQQLPEGCDADMEADVPAPGMYDDLYFYGVATAPSRRLGPTFSPGLPVLRASCDAPPAPATAKRFVFEFDADAASEAGLPQRIRLSCLRDVTATEYLVAPALQPA